MKSAGAVIDLHGLVRARVRGPDFLTAPVLHEFSHHLAAPESSEENLDLDIVLARASDAGALQTGPAGESSESDGCSIGWRGRHLLAHWDAGIKVGGRPRMELRFFGGLFSRFIVSKWIVEPAVRIVAEHKGAAMVHAAAVSDGERAVLIAGAGGAGKTTWVLNWLASGHPHVSDDFSVIHDGAVLSYVTPLRLGARNLMVNKALARMPMTDKLEIFVRTALRRASMSRAKFYFKAPVERAVPGVEICDRSAPSGAFWIEPGAGPRVLAGDEMAALMARVDRDEMHGFGGGSLDDIFRSGVGDEEGFVSAHQKRLAALFKTIPCFALPAHKLPPLEESSSIADLLAWARGICA